MNGDLDGYLRRCMLCGRRCGVDRIRGERGACDAGTEPRVACWLPHAGEEPPLAGTRGSGAIFFSGCSLRCLFCQNYAISRGGQGHEVSPVKLASIMLELQARGCHNINLVSPTPYAPQIAITIDMARARGLIIPVVYNSHGYDSAEALDFLHGKVDVYLPDVKYANPGIARELSGVEDYPEINRAALGHMFSQVGQLQEDPDTGLAKRGLIVRILILPGRLAGARASLVYLKSRFSTDLVISLMAQYAPLHGAWERPPLDRRLKTAEYRQVVDFAWALGFRRLWLQDPEAALCGVPDFSSAAPFVF